MRSSFFVLAICILFRSCSGLPPNPCPKYFGYYRSGETNELFGLITLTDLKEQTLNLEVQVEQLSALPKNHPGGLNFYKDVSTTESNLISGKPVEYRVTFPSQLELPKVVYIALNGIKLCGGTKKSDHYGVQMSSRWSTEKQIKSAPPLTNTGTNPGPRPTSFPPNTCAKYFDYYRNADTKEMFILITLTDLKEQTLNLEVQVEQLSAPQNNHPGSLNFYKDVSTTESNLISGKPVEYRVTFPSQLELPKVVYIALNGIKLCGGTKKSDHYGVQMSSRWSTEKQIKSAPPSTNTGTNPGPRTTSSPPNTCAKYFDYYRNADTKEMFILITLVDLKEQTLNLEVQVEQLSAPPNNHPGSLNFYKDVSTTESNLISGKPVEYRVTFPSQLEQPKVVHITLNGIKLCGGTKKSDHYGVTLRSTWSTAKPIKSQSTIPGPRPAMPAQLTTTTEVYATEEINPFINARFDTSRKSNPFLPTMGQVPRAEQRFSDTQNSATECGKIQNTTPLVVRGTFVPRGQHPWLVPIFEKVDGGSRFLCGGSLISARTVVTAAHCFKLFGLRAEQVTTFLGRNDIVNFGDDGMQPREVEKLVIHPQYESERIPDADIALMYLIKPVSYSMYIKPICLWTEPVDYNRIVGQNAVVAGWGTDEKGNEFTQFPKKVNTEIVSEAKCLRSNVVFRQLTSDRTICAGYRNQSGPCLGDSGSGLMIQRNGVWILRGVVSVGLLESDRCDLGHYVVYCDLAKHRDWLRENMLN